MKVIVFYTGHEPALDEALIQEAGLKPFKVGDQTADNPLLKDAGAIERTNHCLPAHVNRHFLAFEMDEAAGDRFIQRIASPELTIVVNDRAKPAAVRELPAEPQEQDAAEPAGSQPIAPEYETVLPATVVAKDGHFAVQVNRRRIADGAIVPFEMLFPSEAEARIEADFINSSRQG